jgi:hypothetical protein
MIGTLCTRARRELAASAAAAASAPRSPLALVVALAALVLCVPAQAPAAVMVLGSPLSSPATMNTAENLGYLGTYTQVPPSPEAPNGMFHTFHYGADTALWNTELAGGSAAMPVTGQVVKLRLEGCAQSARGGPAPLTQIHFQDVSPLPDGGAKVNISSQGFDIPVCGQAGASASTVSTYEPVNLCVSQGDYVAFNDEGGYVENVYRAGVPYEVLGAARGATVDSFLRNAGTGNGAIMAPSDRSANDGFAVNQDQELLLAVTLGTGPDATHICAGGTAGLPPVLPPVRVGPQTDGVNHSRIVAVAIYCRLMPSCTGVATLTFGGKQVVGSAHFVLRGNATSHMPIRVSPSLIALIRKHHGAAAKLTAVVNGKTIAQTINIKIF